VRTVEKIAPGFPRPHVDESPAEYAARLGALYLREKHAEGRRELGQFFTPLEVARFMARLARPGRKARYVLDPGAGVGILACALCEELQAGPVHIDAYEIDLGLAYLLRATLENAQEWLSHKGVALTFTIHETDFVTENAVYLSETTLFDSSPPRTYDVAVLNPPYFKLGKSDPRARAASEIVHGQPNIYALFMGITASLLADRGVMVSITPRSFTTGDYFRRFREHLFSRVAPEAIHLFDSRKDAFREDSVLQENVILRARKAKPESVKTVRVSASGGIADLKRRRSRAIPLASVLDVRSKDFVFHIPADENDEEILKFVRTWPEGLRSLGLAVSTGPVVAFRSREFLEDEEGDSTVPLLWLHHVRPMAVTWPLIGKRKPQHIRDEHTSRKLLLPSENYVVLRRFSAKEESRRLVAAPLFGMALSKTTIGLENHLNYVYRMRGHLSREEAAGLAAVLGSSLLDRYFRVSNGNTQVNATELRALPLPSLRLVESIGKELMHARPTLVGEAADQIVTEVLRVPHHLGVSPEVLAHG
jgi:adenine-specific DNA-methyltransferase